MPVLPKGGGGPDKSRGLTATAADIAWGKTALVDGQVVTGTMGMLLKDMPTGSIVKSEVGGVQRNFVVVHQGKPSAIYSNTFDNTTILLMEEIYETRMWHSSNVNDYAASDIHAYLNGAFLDLCNAVIRDSVKRVKIPYRPGSGCGTDINTGESGLEAKIWLPSVYEVGWTNNDSKWFHVDGGKLDYLISGASEEANAKRTGYFQGVATRWWLRTPCFITDYGATMTFFVGPAGSHIGAYGNCRINYGIRPALALPDTMAVLPDGTLVG